jgi:outer membrane receptor protein involved in Fe transport
MNDAGDAYVFNGDLTRRETQDDYSFYAQDQWRWKPTVTITAGLRYQFTLPVKSAVGNFTTMTPTDACGPSGLGEGPGGRFCNMF